MQPEQGLPEPLLRSAFAEIAALAQLGHDRSDLSFTETKPAQTRKDSGLHFDRTRFLRLAIGVPIGMQDVQRLGVALAAQAAIV